MEGEAKGYVATFDDITELLIAQRKAAWADVARRIAHEIKNPLTPIQLSAERLKRKYLGEIKNDPDTFTACTDTIIRHVGEIGRMVDEFSSFARMPAPVLRDEDVGEIVRRAAFLQRAATPEMRVETVLPAAPIRIACDSRLVAQALVNLMKNAAESINARDGDAPPGEIDVRLSESDGDDRARGRGQWPRPSAGRARAPDRALRDHAGEGHRARPCHCKKNHGRP